MNLSPATIEAGIRLLEQPAPAPSFGDMLETGGRPVPKTRKHN